MTQRSDVPFNVTILDLTPAKLQGLKPVTSLDIFDGASNDKFHEDGLFSVSIFGRVGDENRGRRFSYIDIKVPVFHPVIYRALVKLKRLYAGIMAGTEYAVWSDEINDFERSNAVDGSTGYAFFLKHWKNIVFEETKSIARDQNVSLLKKFKDTALTSKIVVMPAGMRDAELVNGRIQVDEINNFYRKMLGISNTVSDAAVKHSPEVINTARYNLQVTFNDLYEHLESMIEGKKKLLLDKWAGRRLVYGTRNVITSMDSSVPYLGSPGNPGFNSTVIGLYQMLKAITPVAIHHIRNNYLSQIFTAVGSPARLVNKKTLKTEMVNVKPAVFDRWMTDEGVEKIITAFGNEHLRHKPVEIDGYYLALIYKGPDRTFKIIHDIDEVIPTRNKDDVKPITFCELLYLSVYKVINKFPLFLTRYPITGVGSIYPSKAYVKTTVKSDVRKELNESWEPMDETHTAYQFPATGSAFINSLVPHSSRLKKLGADFDGDTSSANVTYSDEAIKEVDDYLQTRRAYIGTDGKIISSTSVDTVEFVLFNLTGD